MSEYKIPVNPVPLLRMGEERITNSAARDCAMVLLSGLDILRAQVGNRPSRGGYAVKYDVRLPKDLSKEVLHASAKRIEEEILRRQIWIQQNRYAAVEFLQTANPVAEGEQGYILRLSIAL